MTAARVAPVTVQLQAQPAQVPVATGHGLSFWAVVVIALALIALTGATGHWSTGFWVALLVLLLLGALFPPAGLLIGGAALLYLGLTHGQQFSDNVSALIKPSKGGSTP